VVSFANVAGSSPVKLLEESFLYIIEKHNSKLWFYSIGITSIKGGKKLLTVFESGLDSQAHEEYFPRFDWPLNPYPFQVKIMFYINSLN